MSVEGAVAAAAWSVKCPSLEIMMMMAMITWTTES